MILLRLLTTDLEKYFKMKHFFIKLGKWVQLRSKKHCSTVWPAAGFPPPPADVIRPNHHNWLVVCSRLTYAENF